MLRLAIMAMFLANLEVHALREQAQDSMENEKQESELMLKCGQGLEEVIAGALTRIGGAAINNNGCRKNDKCCDAYLREFANLLKGDPDLKGAGTKIKIQWWRWAVRPDKKYDGSVHQPSITFTRPVHTDQKGNTQYQEGEIGLDTHYFTLVNYCGKTMRYDNKVVYGLDVSSDFQINSKGALVEVHPDIAPPVLSNGFSFYYADDAHTKVIHKCEYMQCLHVCKSITMQGVQALSVKHKKKCHGQLTVEV